MCTPAYCHWCGDQQVPRCVTGNARCHITSLSLRINLTISNGYGEPIPPVAIHRIFPAGKSLPSFHRSFSEAKPHYWLWLQSSNTTSFRGHSATSSSISVSTHYSPYGFFPAGKSLPLLYRQSTHGHLLDRRALPMHQFCGQSFRTGEPTLTKLFSGQSFRTGEPTLNESYSRYPQGTLYLNPGGYLLAGSQCTRRDLNPHSVEMDPKSTASAYSATDAEGGAVSCPLFLTFLYEPEFSGSWFLFLLSVAKPRILP